MSDATSDKTRLETMRHSASHVMAEAVKMLFPEAKFGIGPPIEDGFYYDFDLPRPLVPEDLAAIEENMRKSVAAKAPFVREEMDRDKARQLFASQPYKLELIDDLPDQTVTVYRSGSFVDLCRGPHVGSTGEVGAFKLLNIAGAYWRGDEKRPMLQRIYATAFATQAELDEHLKKLAEIEARDHRRLVKQLDLISFHEEAGAGLAYWHPKGGLIRVLIEDYWRKRHLEGGYDIVFTPHIGRAHLWETSGHLGFFRENMYAPLDIDGQEYFLKPMNCPFHIMIYKSRRRSYRDLPLRLAEWGTVYRYERSGVLHGLLRVRGFTQDDAHLFVNPDHVDEAILEVLDFSIDLFHAFGFHDLALNISTRPAKAVGDPSDWDRATSALVRAVEVRGLQYHLREGEGAFYGPKIDIDIKDALGRAWQCTTIQFDFNMAERFGLTFADVDGEVRRPYMVHRALFGSMERFFGVLLEHYGGAFPVWLSPVQAVVIPIADRHQPYGETVAERLRARGLRVEVDSRDDRMRAKIRDAQMQKVPYMLVVGDREVDTGTVAVRLRTEADLGSMAVDVLAQRMVDEVASHAVVEGEG